MSLHLGLDLGGTNIKVVVLEAGADGSAPRRVHEASRPTVAAEGPAAVVDRLVAAGREAAGEAGRFASVGVGVPGLYDPERGTVRFLPNLPGPWHGQPVAAPLAEALGAPAAVVNDARAFTFAEYGLGAARGCRTVVGMVLGTGVGGGLVLEGRLYQGLDGTAGEIGHQTVDVDGPLCGCGNRGCVEAFAAAGAIAQAGGHPTPDLVAAAARAGDERAIAAVERAGAALGIAVANAVVLLTPDRVVVGGGVAGAGELLLEPIRRTLRERVHVTATDHIEVVAGELGAWAGAVGAALWGRERAR